MKKQIALMMALVCMMGICGAVYAEKGFENIYGLFCNEQVLGQPWQVYDMADITTVEQAEEIYAVLTQGASEQKTANP